MEKGQPVWFLIGAQGGLVQESTDCEIRHPQGIKLLSYQGLGGLRGTCNIPIPAYHGGTQRKPKGKTKRAQGSKDQPGAALVFLCAVSLR